MGVSPEVEAFIRWLAMNPHKLADYEANPPAFLDAACRVTDLPTRDAIGDRWARFLTRQDLTGYDPEKLLAMGDDLIRAAIDEAS